MNATAAKFLFYVKRENKPLLFPSHSFILSVLLFVVTKNIPINCNYISNYTSTDKCSSFILQNDGISKVQIDIDAFENHIQPIPNTTKGNTQNWCLSQKITSRYLSEQVTQKVMSRWKSTCPDSTYTISHFFNHCANLNKLSQILRFRRLHSGTWRANPLVRHHKSTCHGLADEC